ncbi:NADH:flavin oxidoreductase [Candidatus Magnetomorum sp. HK-1]|nr:NADH:flavin oxidoreductase [Candidatus Magnetomorum sp. HK-1]
MVPLKYQHLQNKIQLNDLEFTNRLFLAPISTNACDERGYPTPEFENFYLRRAKGLVGAIIIGATSISEDGGVTKRTQKLYNYSQGKALEKIVRSLKKYCPVGIQLFHAGGQGNPDYTGYSLYAPSNYIHPPIGHYAKELNIENIKQIIHKFSESIKISFESGCDFVELHLAHGYLLHEFLSKHFNKRIDEYGGSPTKRCRVLFEILESVQKYSSLHISRIGLKISGEDFVPDGLTTDFYSWLLPKLEKLPLLYYHVTAGIYDSSSEKKHFMLDGKFQMLARKIKNMTKKNIITVGNIKNVEKADTILARGDADIVCMGRALIADPYLFSKSLGIKKKKFKTALIVIAAIFYQIIGQMQLLNALKTNKIIKV